MDTNVVVNVQAFYGGGGGQESLRPYEKLPAFDFTDDFYRKHGISPDKILDRLVGQEESPQRSVKYASPHADFTNVRILETTGGYSNEGLLMFYPVTGKLMPDSFIDNAVGKQAMSVANQFRAFIFPKAKGNPLDPSAPNRRQDNMFDLATQYFIRNPLGLWHLTFVSYIKGAARKKKCRQMLNELKEKNGVDTDGTPVIKNLNEIDELNKLGCVEFQHRAADGSDGFPWVI